MHTLHFILSATFLLAGCGSSDSDPKADEKAAIDYSAIDAKVKAAKTSDDWLQIIMDCGAIEINAAMGGDQKIGEDAEFNEHCGTGLKFARARQVVALSTPDSMHSSCLTASTDMDELIEQGKAVDEAKALKDKVNAACGL